MSDRRPVVRPSQANACCISFLVLIMVGVYFYYEMFVQSNIRFPRDLGERNALYGAGTISVDTDRYSWPGWWAFQAHQFFLLGAVFFFISYIFSEAFYDSSVSVFCGIFTAFFLVGVAASLTVSFVWYLATCTTSGCAPIVRSNDPAAPTVESAQYTQIWVFYLIMALLATLGAALSLCFCITNRKKQREVQYARDRASDAENMPLINEGAARPAFQFADTFSGDLKRRNVASATAQLFAKSLNQKMAAKKK